MASKKSATVTTPVAKSRKRKDDDAPPFAGAVPAKQPEPIDVEALVQSVAKGKKLKIPKGSAQAADLWYAVREFRLEEAKRVKAIQDIESQLRQHLIDTIPKSLATGVSGKRVQVQIIQKEVLAVQDNDAFMKYAHRKGNEDLLVERPNSKAVEDRIEAGKKIPGVGYNKFADIKYKSLS